MGRTLRKFTKEGIFVTKTANYRYFVKPQGYSNLERGCLLSEQKGIFRVEVHHGSSTNAKSDSDTSS
jgi:hypothetical protein